MEKCKNAIVKPAIIFVLSFLFMMANPFQSVSAALGNGIYSIPYTVIKPDDGSASMADGYLVKPATVTVKDGSYIVKLTLKNSSWITEFKPNGANPTLLSTSGDTRTIQFVANITSPVITKMKVDIDDMNYHHEYTVRLSFNTGSAKLISGGEEKPKEETKQEEKKETTTTSKTETPTKEKATESTSSTASKQTESQSNKQTSQSTEKNTASPEATKASDKSEDEKVSDKVAAKEEERTTEVEETKKKEEVTKEESEEKAAVKKDEPTDKEEDADEPKQSLNTEYSVKETASANIENEEKGMGPIAWSILAVIIALGLGLGIYRYKVRKQ